MRKVTAGALILGAILFGAARKLEAQVGGPYVSPSYYFERELQYGHRQYPYYTAVPPGTKTGGNRPAFEMNLITDRREDIEFNAYPYTDLRMKSFSDDLPVWDEVEIYCGDYWNDSYPQWAIGPYFRNAQIDDKFYWHLGTEWRMLQPKGVKAYTTTILDGPGGGKYFIDLVAGAGRKMEADSGRPVLTNRLTWDLAANAGYRTGSGWNFAVSVVGDEGKFRNFSAGVGKSGIDGRIVVNVDYESTGSVSLVPGLAFNFRTPMPEKKKKK